MTPEMPLVVVDANVAVKWFVSDGEGGLSDAHELLEQHAENQVRLVSPSLLVHELTHVLRRRGIDLRDAAHAFHDFDVLLVSPDRELSLAAADLIATQGVSTFDAAYAALALTLGCRLATADRRLATALGSAVEVLLVEA